MNHPPAEIEDLLTRYNQRHLLAGWDLLDHEQRAGLIAQIRDLHLGQLGDLFAQRDEMAAVPAMHRIQPLPHVLPDAQDSEARAIGESALSRGEVAALVVAGGQGSRLGFEHPKGMFAVSPVTHKSLFQWHVEKVLARTRRHGKPIPLLVMTSHATHAETEEFFQRHNFFGLAERDVYFFRQGTMPALDLTTGQLLLEAPDRIFASPNGHGGTLTAMADTGLIDQLRHAGVRHVFYFQVDNPLVKIADPTFLGQHIRARADVSSKVIPKEGPFDKLGNLVLVDGKLSIIEYSDLPPDVAEKRRADGSLLFSVGNPAIHVMSLDFLDRVTGDASAMPFHIARKKVPFWDPELREFVIPQKENALKFERFIFDILPLCERWCAVATSRREEFAPLKNATGPDSPTTVRQAISDLSADWLRSAGADIAEGIHVEVGPLTALEPGDVRIPAGTKVRESSHW